ncbi:T9SS type A sorting domain-containing protein [Hymenobacter rubripertinctus]|uniref:T9SS C-terminal target domain-containing protein n=1 Tax=Hymenobacter rubripertinctus TaxID=2029981 RepID=A0A418QIW2_9BACT|nr:T9SS type A sorting domain-containing protein [Hymenobacter rubripertinctus]RIY05094.1 T9SS C-terminal target domain-containing protein [Hymenobacter rubripertinctus]
MKKLLLLPALLAAFSTSHGQTFVRDPKPAPRTVCYASPEVAHTKLPLPAAYLQQQSTPRRGAATSRIEVAYTGFTPQAQAAFQRAIDIWESLLISPVTIRVQATWTSLGPRVLGSAGATAYYQDLSGATRGGVLYPVALAEKISGQDLNSPTEPDISARFSSDTNWYYGLDGKTPAGKYDLVSVVLHELCHGLGFIASTSYSSGTGSYSNPPSIYGTYMQNQAGQALTNNAQFPNSSLALGTQYTGNQLYFNSPLAKAVNSSFAPRLYAPNPYESGSSISHLNESTYTSGDLNSLMTPQIASAEAMHNPGPITLRMFDEMGWFNTAIRHKRLPDSEVAQDFPVTATVVSDGTVTPGSVKLVYTVDNAPVATVAMTSLGGNQYRGVIGNPGLNHTVRYYITAADNETGRTYTAPATYQPGVATVDRYSFAIGPDVTVPVVRHQAPTYRFADKLPLVLTAQATDNLGVASVTAEYAVNGVAQPAVGLTRQAATDTYSGAVGAAANLKAGDVVTYRLVTRDAAAATNQVVSPGSGTYTVNIVAFKAAQSAYTNNLNTATPLDFVGEGFTITQPAGFSNAAIHSDHQYTDDSTRIYQLLVPIRIAAPAVTMSYDEIVLVEPGEPNSKYGTEEFYDYVVVEGSSDQGTSWQPLVSALTNGYDSALQPEWLAAWNAGLNAIGSSTTVGTPALFKPHTFDLAKTFAQGDEVRLRFRLTSDPGAHGWGWAVDNLTINNVVTGVASGLQAAGGLTVYPNPNAGQFRVRATFARPTSGLELLVRNSLGQVVYRRSVPTTTGQLDLPVDLGSLASGLYQVSLGSGTDAAARKVLIQR